MLASHPSLKTYIKNNLSHGSIIFSYEHCLNGCSLDMDYLNYIIGWSGVLSNAALDPPPL